MTAIVSRLSKKIMGQVGVVWGMWYVPKVGFALVLSG